MPDLASPIQKPTLESLYPPAGGGKAGRENIYLNGAILGMKRAEIERKFDEIVAFAETPS
jgi:hypothetical protein